MLFIDCTICVGYSPRSRTAADENPRRPATKFPDGSSTPATATTRRVPPEVDARYPPRRRPPRRSRSARRSTCCRKPPTRRCCACPRAGQNGHRRIAPVDRVERAPTQPHDVTAGERPARGLHGVDLQGEGGHRSASSPRPPSVNGIGGRPSEQPALVAATPSATMKRTGARAPREIDRLEPRSAGHGAQRASHTRRMSDSHRP